MPSDVRSLKSNNHSWRYFYSHLAGLCFRRFGSESWPLNKNRMDRFDVEPPSDRRVRRGTRRCVGEVA